MSKFLLLMLVGCGSSEGDWTKTRDAHCGAIQSLRAAVDAELESVISTVRGTPPADPVARLVQCEQLYGELAATSALVKGFTRAAKAIEEGRPTEDLQSSGLSNDYGFDALRDRGRFHGACRADKLSDAAAVVDKIKVQALSVIETALTRCKARS